MHLHYSMIMVMVGLSSIMLRCSVICADEITVTAWETASEVTGSVTHGDGLPVVQGRSLYTKQASQSASESSESAIKERVQPILPARALHTTSSRRDSHDHHQRTTARKASTSASRSRLSVSKHRGGDTPILGNENPTFYNYVPATILDGLYRTWWCSNCMTCEQPGDHIWYAEAAGPGGPYGDKKIVFHPTGDYSDFDGNHTCDPNVVYAKGLHYLYYGGCCGTDEHHETAIGVALSRDGAKTFKRMNGGKPIIESAKAGVGSNYGAGQPSVIFKDDWFYMVYTDVSSRKQLSANLLFLTRSKDPTFQTGREEWQFGKFVAYDPATSTCDPFQSGASASWMYSDAWKAFILAVAGTQPGSTTLTLWRDDLSKSFASLELPGSWTEGPGLVTKPDGHAPPSQEALSTVPIDSLRSVGKPLEPFHWQLAWNGMDVKWSSVDDAKVNVGKLYDGMLLHCHGLPVAFITGGRRVQIESNALWKYLSATTVQVSSEVYHRIPFGASLHKKELALAAPGRPGAFLLNDGKLWPLGCLGLVTDNESQLVEIRTDTWDKFKLGLNLHCMHPTP